MGMLQNFDLNIWYQLLDIFLEFYSKILHFTMELNKYKLFSMIMVQCHINRVRSLFIVLLPIEQLKLNCKLILGTSVSRRQQYLIIFLYYWSVCSMCTYQLHKMRDSMQMYEFILFTLIQLYCFICDLYVLNLRGDVPYGWTAADLLVFRKVRSALGFDRCKFCMTAAAPIMKSTLDFFMSLNLPLMEIFGMSESTGKHNCFDLARLRIV